MCLGSLGQEFIQIEHSNDGLYLLHSVWGCSWEDVSRGLKLSEGLLT